MTSFFKKSMNAYGWFRTHQKTVIVMKMNLKKLHMWPGPITSGLKTKTFSLVRPALRKGSVLSLHIKCLLQTQVLFLYRWRSPTFMIPFIDISVRIISFFISKSAIDKFATYRCRSSLLVGVYVSLGK